MPATPGRALAAGAFVAAGLALAGCGTVTTSATPQVVNLNGSGHFAGDEVSPPFTPPAGSFTDTAGASYDLAAHVTGRVTLLFFGYTKCPDICPTTMADLGKALRSLPAPVDSQVQVVFVTSDPKDDTPAVMAKWLANFDTGVSHPFLGLTSALPAVQAYARKVGVELDNPQTDASGKTTDAHSAQVLAFSPDGAAHLVWTPGTTPQQYASDITKLVAGTT